ncbi:MAG: alpha/beta fold hydrolase [Legionella sp.]
MPRIKVNDINMYYEVHGQGEPVVCIGGFSSDHTIWSELPEYFKDKYQLVLFDNRGAGQTDIPDGPYSIEQMANDVVDLCSALEIKHAHFVGNSMGGFMLQHLAFRHPELVKSAIIGNSGASIHTVFHVYVDAQLELLKANAPLKSLLKASSSLAFSYHFLSQPGALEQLIQLVLDNPYPFTVKGYEGQYADLEQLDSRDWIQKINVPVLVLGAEDDLIIPEK